MRKLEEINSEYALNDVFKRTALKSLMVGKAKDHYEIWEGENKAFDTLRDKCKEYAAKRRLEANNRKGANDPMDVDNVNQDQQEEEGKGEWTPWENEWQWTWAGDMDAVGKGKGKGNWSWGKSKGKGK